MTPQPLEGTSARLLGVDLARFVALIGMMGAHLAAPRFPTTWLETITGGFPSTLFAVVGGFGIVFASRRYLSLGLVGAAKAATIGRGAVVAGLGFLLEYLPNNPIAVILVYFGVAIMCSAMFVNCPSWVLAVAALGLGILSPNALALAGAHVDTAKGLSLLRPGSTFVNIFLTGTYPVVTWLTYLLVGMVLARWVLASRRRGTLLRTSATLFVGGTLVGAGAWMAGEWYLAHRVIPHNPGVERDVWMSSMHGQPPTPGWEALFLISPHSGSSIDVLRTGGVAGAVIGACLLVAAHWPPVPVLLRPVTAAGGAPLTIYVLHLVATSAALTASGGISYFWDAAAPWWLHWWFLWQLLLVLGVGAILSGTHKRGPLEVLTSEAASAAAQGFLDRKGTA